MKKFILAITLMLVIVPCTALLSACGCTFLGIPNTYTVTFVDYDETVIDTQTVNSGEDAVPPENPTRTGYTFASWEGNYENITADVTITATYTISTYTVTFVDYDETTVIDTQTINYGGSATAPADPVTEGYIFTGWNPSTFTNI